MLAAWAALAPGRLLAHTGVPPAPHDLWRSWGLEPTVVVPLFLTAWLYSPEAQPMDLRFYHDGLGQDTFEEQLEGLEITYEDYEPGFGTPTGIARTSELTLFAYNSTPPTESLAADAAAAATPALLQSTPEYLHSAGVFGDWDPVDRSTPARARLEDRLD